MCISWINKKSALKLLMHGANMKEGQSINIYKVIDFEKRALRLSLLIDLFVYSSFNDILISITQQDDSWLMNETGHLRAQCPSVLTGLLWWPLLNGLRKGTTLGEDGRSALDMWTVDFHLIVIFCGKLIKWSYINATNAVMVKLCRLCSTFFLFKSQGNSVYE